MLGACDKIPWMVNVTKLLLHGVRAWHHKFRWSTRRKIHREILPALARSLHCVHKPHPSMPPSNFKYELYPDALSSVLRVDGIESGFIGTLHQLFLSRGSKESTSTPFQEPQP